MSVLHKYIVVHIYIYIYIEKLKSFSCTIVCLVLCTRQTIVQGVA